jgi:hypothetical protein
MGTGKDGLNSGKGQINFRLQRLYGKPTDSVRTKILLEFRPEMIEALFEEGASMGRHVYAKGFREQFIQMMRLRNAPKCRICNRPELPQARFANCPRCGWELCPHCQRIHKPERHDWKEGTPTELTKCEMCGTPSTDLAPCTACLFMLCPLCRSRHKPEQHQGRSRAVAVDKRFTDEVLKRTIARVGNPPHGETPARLSQFEPDCAECQQWYEEFRRVHAEEFTSYLREQEGIWKEHFKDIVIDLEISEEEIGGPL